MDKYDAILMLSGGKDSCSLAMDLVDNDVRILAVTVDNGFLSDVARSNIDKLVKLLNIDSLMIRPAPAYFQQVIDMDADMVKTCSECSFRTLKIVLQCAKNHCVNKIYAGFTKYTAKSQGWGTKNVSTIVGDFEIINPYYGEYDLNKIRERMTLNGLEFDPTKTNCIHIQRLIHRSEDNPFVEELDALRGDGFIPDDEYARVKEWLTQK